MLLELLATLKRQANAGLLTEREFVERILLAVLESDEC